MRYLFIILFCGCFVIFVTGQDQTKTAVHDAKEFSEAKTSGISEISSFEKWNFTYGADGFEIRSDGSGERVTRTNVIRRTKFRLPLPDDESIDGRLYFTFIREI